MCSSDLVWPGGGITLMVDVTTLPEQSFGYVPTPALVAPIEFTMRKSDYAALGGHMDYVLTIEDVLAGKVGRQNDHKLAGKKLVSQRVQNRWPTEV